MSDNNWPDPARPGVPLNPEREGWHWVQRADKGFVPSPRIILWTDDWTSGQFSWDAIGYSDDERKLGRDFRYLGPVLTPAEVEARVQQARRDAMEEAAPREMPSEFLEWMKRQMPKNTIIGNPEWWAGRIWRAAIRALKGEGDE